MSLTTNYEIETIAKERGPLKTIFILDEFAQLPPINAVPKATRLYRSKGIQLWFFAQGRFSLRERWPEVLAKEFEDQAAVVTMRSISEPDLIRDISLWSGNATILNRGVSHNGGTVETAAANLGEQKRSARFAYSIWPSPSKCALLRGNLAGRKRRQRLSNARLQYIADEGRRTFQIGIHTRRAGKTTVYLDKFRQ